MSEAVMPPANAARAEDGRFVCRRGTSTRDEDYATFWEMGGAANGLSLVSAALFVVDPGASSPRHHHKKTEEMYLIVSGRGIMNIGAKYYEVAAGESICIPIGAFHAIRNPGLEPLAMWVVTSPQYDPEDDIVGCINDVCKAHE